MRFLHRLFHKSKPTEQYVIRNMADFWNSLDLDNVTEVNVHGQRFIKVVRCKDCKWYTQFRNINGGLFPEGECEGYGLREPNDFCSRGERKVEE